MALFLNEDRNNIPDLLTNPVPPSDLDIDLVIDDQGHTALHWAAALGRIQILKLLVERGADLRRLNNFGESALVRAVLVTNNYDNQTLPELLAILSDAIPLIDNRYRSILHHVAFTVGIKGRSHAARYYMECVLHRIGELEGDYGSIIDIQDKHGDTALNVAARFGNRNLVEQLLDVGASPNIENKAGIRPVDFGIEDLLHHGAHLRAAAAVIADSSAVGMVGNGSYGVLTGVIAEVSSTETI
jgi:regulatory protein SWI6